MSCGFEHFDGAYVLGALSAAERLEFERHLTGCDACTARVRQLAGLPGLLGRVEADVLEEDAEPPPLPETLLPALCHDVRRAQRRRTWLTAGVAAAAAALVVGVGAVAVTVTQSDDPGTSVTTVDGQAMRPVGTVPIRADLALEKVTWGTRIELECTYDPAWVDYELPDELTYAVVVRTRSGDIEEVGTWRSVGGRTMQLEAATATPQEDIASVEVRTPDGRVVLRSTA